MVSSRYLQGHRWRLLDLYFYGPNASLKPSNQLTLVMCFYFYTHLLRLGIKQPSDIYLEKRQICFFSTANLGESIMEISKTVTLKTTDNRKYQYSHPNRKYLSLIPWQAALKFWWQIWGLRARMSSKKCQQLMATTNDNGKGDMAAKSKIIISIELWQISSKFHDKFRNFDHDVLDKSVVAKWWLRQRRTIGNGNIGVQNGHITISGCRSSLQSPGNTFVDLTMVDTPGSAAGISTSSVIIPEI